MKTNLLNSSSFPTINEFLFPFSKVNLMSRTSVLGTSSWGGIVNRRRGRFAGILPDSWSQGEREKLMLLKTANVWPLSKARCRFLAELATDGLLDAKTTAKNRARKCFSVVFLDFVGVHGWFIVFHQSSCLSGQPGRNPSSPRWADSHVVRNISAVRRSPGSVHKRAYSAYFSGME